MTHPTSHIALSFALLSLVGCGSRDRVVTGVRTDSAGITLVRSAFPAWDATEAWRITGPVASIGTTDGSPEQQLHRVRGVVRLNDGSVVVANAGSSEIRLYAPDGRWIRSLGGEGDGPREFRLIRRIQIVPPDTLIVFDDRGPRVTVLTMDGTLVDSRRLASPGGPLKPPDHRLRNGRWLDLARSAEIEGYQRRRNSYVSWSEADTSAADTILAHVGHEYLIYIRHQGGQYVGRGAVVVPFGGQDLAAIGPDRVALSDGQVYSIAVAEIGGREFRVRRTIERQPVANEVSRRFVDEYVAPYPSERQQQVRDQFQKLTSSPLMPTHAALTFDSAGNLWVENYRLPWDNQSPRTWSVFDREGQWLGDLELPRGLRVYEIGDNHIAGVERDDMGVEYVRLYQLVKP